jgi:hypothetical protein
MNLAAYDRRFTDRDVRENDELIGAAITYLRSYGGDFEFLVNAKFYLAQNRTLSVPIARAVLNCQRSDPSAQNLRWPLQVQPRKLEPIDVRRPHRYRLKSHWNVEFCTSMWSRAYLIHRIDIVASALYYYTRDGRFEFRLVTRCKGNQSLLVPITDAQVGEQEAQGRTVCQKCEEYVVR